MQANRLFQAPMQEGTQQPTLTRSIRAMKREREGGGGERKWAEGGVKGHQSCRGGVGGKQERLRDHTEMTKHRA